MAGLFIEFTVFPNLVPQLSSLWRRTLRKVAGLWATQCSALGAECSVTLLLQVMQPVHKSNVCHFKEMKRATLRIRDMHLYEGIYVYTYEAKTFHAAWAIHQLQPKLNMGELHISRSTTSHPGSLAMVYFISFHKFNSKFCVRHDTL